jgi:FkbM family methyltransferase
MLDAALVGIGRIIGKPHGWERIVRAVAPPQRFARGAIVNVERDGYVFPIDRGTLIGWSVHFFGTYEPEVRAEIRRFLHAGDVAVDVGANVGWHALLMASLVGPHGRVCAFEPNTTTRDRLMAAVAANRLQQIHVDARALSDYCGTATFQAPEAGDVWDGTGHLQGQVGQAGQAGQAGRAGQAGQVVQCLTLDDFATEQSLDRIALIKIDVEGWELTVLQGGRGVLETMRPAVIFEFDPSYVSRCGGSSDDLLQCFDEAGYVLFALHPRHGRTRVGRLGAQGGNFLAVPRERASGS